MDQGSPSPVAALTGLLVLAVFYTLYFASAIVLPVLVAVLLSVILAPLAHWLRRHGLPRGIAAGVVTAGLMLMVGIGIERLAAPAADWLERAPQSVSEIERKLRPVKEPVEQVKKATEQVERLAGAAESKAGTVTVKSFDVGSVFVVSVTQLTGQALVVVFLLFFLLASGPRLVRRLAMMSDDPARRHRIVAVARRVKQDVTLYLGMVSIVNVGLGLITGLVMWGLDMPNPALWGVLAAILNFVPYGGAFLTTIILAVVGLLSFDELWRGLLPAGAFLILTTVESDVVTPWVIGRRLTMPPLVVFVSLLVWGWLWGVIGALLAVPILVLLRVAADHVEGLRPLAPFLGGNRRKV
jgi:predicted PurR-regulated permease PerM